MEAFLMELPQAELHLQIEGTLEPGLAFEMARRNRVDHGVECTQDERLVERLVAEQMPLTVCPFSNVKLPVFPELRQHNFAQMLRQGLFVTINSDDPAYFGGYIGESYVGTAKALGLTVEEMIRVAHNCFSASFLPETEEQRHLEAVDAYAATAAWS